MPIKMHRARTKGQGDVHPPAFPSPHASSPAFTPLPQPLHLFTKPLHLFTQRLHLFTNLFDSIHVYIKDCEVLLSK